MPIEIEFASWKLKHNSTKCKKIKYLWSSCSVELRSNLASLIWKFPSKEICYFSKMSKVCFKLTREIIATHRVLPRDLLGGSDSWNWITQRGKTRVFCLFLHHMCLCQSAAAAWLQTLPSGYPPVSAAWFSTGPLGWASLVVFSSLVRYTLGNTIGSFSLFLLELPWSLSLLVGQYYLATRPVRSIYDTPQWSVKPAGADNLEML